MPPMQPPRAALLCLALAGFGCGFVPPSRPHARLLWSSIGDSDPEVTDLVTLRDASSGRGLVVVKEFELDVNGGHYVVGVPADTPAAICVLNGDGELEPLEMQSELHDELVSLFEVSLEDYDVLLLRTPLTLTLQGDIDGEEDAQSLDEEEEVEAEEEEENSFGRGGLADFTVDGDYEAFAGTGQDEEEEEDVEWLAEDVAFEEQEEVDLVAAVEWEGQRYNLVQLLEPVLVVGRLNNETGEVEIPSSEELDRVFPLLEAKMEVASIKSSEN